MKQYTIKSETVISNNKKKLSSDIALSNLVSIFKNNELLQEEDYSIKDNKIIFTEELLPDDQIITNYNIETNQPIIGYNSSSRPILQKYNSDIKLNENNKYHVCIAIDKDTYKWSFNSMQNPMFTTYKKILEDIGEFIDGFTEEYINNKIYENSIAVIDLIDQLANQEDAVTNVTYEKDENGIYTTEYKAVNNWVRYKTDIDLTLARYFGISYKYGSELKEIGDIKIEKTTKLPYIDNLLDMLKKKFDAADETIKGVNFVASAVKAGTQYKYDDWDRDTTW